MYNFLSSKSKVAPNPPEGPSAKAVSKSPLTIFPSQSPLTIPTDGASPRAATTQRVPLQNISSMSRSQLEDQLKKNGDNTDPNICAALGKMLLKAGTDGKIDRVKYMKTGLLLMEAGLKKGGDVPPSDMLIMANGYHVLWLTSGVASEAYWLERAVELYEIVGDIQTPFDLLSYCRVLQYLNKTDAAAGVITSLLSVADGDLEYPSYLLYAGDIFKAQGNHEQAASYFFEATQLGPPRLFSKLEMMFIISRNIEESAKDKDEPCDDAYEMVRISHPFLFKQAYLAIVMQAYLYSIDDFI